MNIVDEMNLEIIKLIDKLNSGSKIEEKDFELLFIKSLIEEETGNGPRTRE